MKTLSKKLTSLVLAFTMVFGLSVPAFAAENSGVSGLNVSGSHIEYIEEREDGTYFISENINGTSIVSMIYKLENNNKIFVSRIDSQIQNGKVLCNEKNAYGEVVAFQVSANINKKSVQSDESNSIKLYSSSVNSNRKKYLRTDYYGISLVGKKITVAIAAGAIVAVTPYVSVAVAIKIITAALSGGAVGAVSVLPDYLHVKSDIYRTYTGGRIRTRYENEYYLDSNRTEYIGSWAFSKRVGH